MATRPPSDDEPPHFTFSVYVPRTPPRKPSQAVAHFGEMVRPGKYGHRLTREMYALPNKRSSHYANQQREWFTDEQWAADSWAYEDEAHVWYSDDYCERQRERALLNYDLNMSFFARLDAQVLQAALSEMLRKHKRLRPVTDLHDLDGVEGVYVMVLDAYKQAYVGTSVNIRNRIKQHWSGMQQFDRLLDGSVYESVLAVDCFRALDTTRLFAANVPDPSDLEFKIERALPADYLLNRNPGGVPGGGFTLLVQTLAKKRRKLTATDEPG